MGKINILSEHVANVIAAGEVINSPFNVVKELVENALDAKANKIEVRIINGGKTSIVVNDNGTGMDEEDIKKSFIRHATSKIQDEKDLFFITSFGFRGEALPSIAAVSKIKLTSSIDGINGYTMEIEGGKQVDFYKQTAAKGTSVSVSNLFYNTPARFKHLKSVEYENASIINLISKIAYIESKVAIKLVIDGKTILNTLGKGSQINVIAETLGNNVAANMIDFEYANSDYKIYGHLSKVSVYRTNKNYITVFCNKRIIKSYILTKAITDAYLSNVPEKHYPIVFINIDMDPSIIDVNIHPTKEQIKMAGEMELFKILSNEIEKKLHETIFVLSAKSSNQDIQTKRVREQLDNIPTIKEQNNLQNAEKEQSTPTNLFNYDSNAIREYLQVICQLNDTYILATSSKGYYLIDQHAAQERYNYEQFLNIFTSKNVPRTSSLIPIISELSIDKYNQVISNIHRIEDLGFEINMLSNNSVSLESYPYIFNEVELDSFFNDLLETVIENKENSISNLLIDKLARLACRKSIKANKKLDINEMQEIVNKLLKCNKPETCPHGRPTMIYYAYEEIDRAFKRKGF